MRSVELFTGAGGLALGLQGAGFESVLMVEWNDDAYATIKANAERGGPTHGWPIHHADVRDVTFQGLGEVDLVAGGPPCQPFSIGGKHKGPNDPRDMWPHAIRAVRELTPKMFLFENVRGLAREAFADYLQYIVERLRRPAMLAKPGESWKEHLVRLRRLPPGQGSGPIYRVEVHKINAADYGAPQKRHRVIIAGVRLDLDSDWTFPDPTHSREALMWDQLVTREYWGKHKISAKMRNTILGSDWQASKQPLLALRPTTKPWRTVRDAIGDLPDPQKAIKNSIMNHRFQPGARSYAGHTGSPFDGPAKALKAGDHGVPGGENMLLYPDGSVRYLTVRESARLQDFPDDFIFPGSWSETMRQLGNAVPVSMATIVASSMSKALDRYQGRGKKRRAA